MAERNTIKDGLEKLNPTQEQSEAMWKRLEESMAKVETVETETLRMSAPEKTLPESESPKIIRLQPWRGLAAAMIALVIFSGSLVTANALTNGRVLTAIQRGLGLAPHEDIVNTAVTAQSEDVDIYAADILYMDPDYLVFGNVRGILVFDNHTNRLLGTIDSQAIDCIYFNSDPTQTCVVRSGDDLIVFNEKDGHAEGNYYEYNVQSHANAIVKEQSQTDETAAEQSQTDETAAEQSRTDGTLPLESQGNDPDQLIDYEEMWTENTKQNSDTFSAFSDQSELADIFGSLDSDDEVMYSEHSIGWKEEDGTEMLSFLTIQGDTYTVYDYDVAGGEIRTRELDFTMDTEAGATDNSDTDQTSAVPEFVYSGDDPEVNAICTYLYTELAEEYYAPDDSVWIPEFIIYKEVEKDGDYMVFGNFWSEWYIITGDVMESTSGGAMPACFHLKKTNSGYQVVSYETAEDGSDYDASLKELTKDYPEVYRQFNETTDEERTKAREQYLTMYIRENDLSVSYYKDYGWDPVPLEQ